MLRAGTKRKTTMRCLQALSTRKGIKNSSKDDVAIAESLDTKQRIVPTRKVARKRAQRINLGKGDTEA